MTLVKQLLRIAGALVLLVVGLLAFDFYEAYPVKSFCWEVPATAAAETVLALAQNKRLRTLDRTAATRTIAILNHDSPLFRYACMVEFQNGHQIQKEVVTAD